MWNSNFYHVRFIIIVIIIIIIIIIIIVIIIIIIINIIIIIIIITTTTTTTTATTLGNKLYPICLQSFGIIYLHIWKILMCTNFLKKLSYSSCATTRK